MRREALDGDVMTVPEVAKLLRIGRNAVYEAAAKNEIPHVRIGRLLRFSRAALLAWLGHAGRATLDSWSSHVAKEGQ